MGVCYDVVVVFFYFFNYLGNEFGVVVKVGVYDDDVVVFGVFEVMDVGGVEVEFVGVRVKLDVRGVGFDELGGDFLGFVWGVVVYNDKFLVEVFV